MHVEEQAVGMFHRVRINRHLAPNAVSVALRESVEITSESGNLDGDWTKLSDLAERQRIENRIAQREYR
jgi:hypothetical protein